MKKKIIIYLLSMLILMSLLTSCKDDASPSFEKLFKYIENAEYPRIYGMLSDDSHDKITIDTFCQRYENIYTEIKADTIKCSLVSLNVAGNIANSIFDITFNSKTLGIFMLRYEVDFLKEDEDWKIIYTPSMIIPGLGEDDIIRITSMLPARGEIFDTNGDILVKNEYAISVYANIDKIEDGDSFIKLTAVLLDVTEEYLKEKIHSFYDKLDKEEKGLDEKLDNYKSVEEIIVLKTYPKDKGIDAYIEQELLKIPGIGIESDVFSKVRYYPNTQLLAHTLGYTGIISEQEAALEENIMLTGEAIVGKTGLEKRYEDMLRGETGYRIEIVDNLGHVQDPPVVYKTAVDGADLRLSIDIEIQRQAELLLMENLTNEMAGSVVMLNPQTGELKAIASYPSYDANIFSFKISNEVWDILNDPINKNPLYNRATLGLYPPGSSFKPFTAAIALDNKAITYDFVFKQEIRNNKWLPKNDAWVYPEIKRYSRTAGDLNLKNAIIYSDNIYFAYAAIETGKETFYNKMSDLGFNSAIDSDLFIATPRITNSDHFENIKILADTGYGQGEILITPLQMSAMFSIFANDGVIAKPTIIKSISATKDGSYMDIFTTGTSIWKAAIMSETAIKQIKPLLQEVVERGTGTAVWIKGKKIHGKTGTAEIGNDKSREIAWFIGFTYNPEPLLVCVTLEVPEGEGSIRSTIAKALFAIE